MSNVVPFEYQGHPVHFSFDGWLNATEIAKRFGKQPYEWLRLPETVEYMEALAEVLNTGKSRNLIRAERGRGGGTWLHPKLAVSFARWLDIRFSVWCDLHIDALLRGEMNAQQQFDKACKALTNRKELASAQGRGLSQWRREKPPLEARVEYWRRELQIPLQLVAGGDQ